MSAILWDGPCGRLIFSRGMASSSHLICQLPLHSPAWLNLQPDFTAHPIRASRGSFCEKFMSAFLPGTPSGCLAAAYTLWWFCHPALFQTLPQVGNHCSPLIQGCDGSSMCMCEPSMFVRVYMCAPGHLTFSSVALKRSSKTTFSDKYMHIMENRETHKGPPLIHSNPFQIIIEVACFLPVFKTVLDEKFH